MCATMDKKISRWETGDAVPAEPIFRLLTTLVAALEKQKRS